MPRINIIPMDRMERNEGASCESLLAILGRLKHTCRNVDAHPFVRPFGDVVNHLSEALTDTPVPSSVEPAMADLAKFLDTSFDPAARVAFPLVLIDPKTSSGPSSIFEDVGDALSMLGETKLDDQWHGVVSLFSQRCEDVWQLYVYLAFLDIKGDRALVEQTIVQFCTLLDCSATCLALSLANTQPWAEEVLTGLANKEYQDLLRVLHVRSLQQWHTEWNANYMALGSNQFNDQVNVFWDTCFVRAWKVPYSDFLEAFHSFCVQGSCPADIDEELHRMIDPALGHCVTRSAWQSVLAKHKEDPATSLLEVALNRLSEDITPCIYRKGALPALDTAQSPPMMPATMGDGAANGSKRRSGKTHSRSSQDTEAAPPLTEASQSFMAQPQATGPETSTAVTPPDRKATASGARQKMSWNQYHAQLAARPDHQAWWRVTDENVSPISSTADQELRFNALRVVKSSLLYTNRTLALRIVSGELARHQPMLQIPDMLALSGKAKTPSIPTIIITANGGTTNGVTSFGRGAMHSICQPDHTMKDPIASRSHFRITFNEEEQRYCLNDSGSKWGTFVRLNKPYALKCGDWIRAGVAEFVVRYCGGACTCHQHHAQHRVRSLQLSRQYARAPAARAPCGAPPAKQDAELDSNLPQREPKELDDELALLLSSRPMRGWTSTSTRLCHAGAVASECVASRTGSQPSINLQEFDTLVPTTPLELEFVAGPRMGEKVTLWDRLSTLGRSESTTLQITDDVQVQNVSRVHCIFHFSQHRWHIQDNQSTNGTWCRLSCQLEPSEPLPLEGGELFLAANHEFVVETLDTGKSCLPSVASTALTDLCNREQSHAS